MGKFVPVVVIKELSETDKILTALKSNGINTAEITFRTACAAEAIEYACKNYPDMSSSLSFRPDFRCRLRRFVTSAIFRTILGV